MIKYINPENGFCWNQVDPEYVSPTKFNTIISELKSDTELLQFKWVNLNIKYFCNYLIFTYKGTRYL